MWRPGARTPDGFEEFYVEHRDRLLEQCFALTGDLPSSQRAVRDAMVVARHHWRKVSRLEDPQDWVRPLAWSRAQRRSQARPWSRPTPVDADHRATLDALDRLSRTQRTVLLLTVLTRSPLDSIAREAGVGRTIAERDLQTATAQVAVHRDVPSTSVRAHIDGLADETGGTRWPRASTVARQGASRRRAHTLAGVAVVVAGLVGAGTLVTEPGGATPALATKDLTRADARTTGSSATAAPAEPDPLTPEELLTADQIGADVTGQWTESATTTNTAGDGLAFTCQAARYADPHGLGALVRTFTGTSIGARATSSALTGGQSAEVSADADQAQRAYTTTLDWYAGCMSPRAQLVSTHTVTGVGDQAALLVLRDWKDPETTQVVGVARTGRLITTVVDTRADGVGTTPRIDLAARASLLGTAVTGLCALPDHGTCTTTPAVQDALPFAEGDQPGLIGEMDLPPVHGVDAPWVGSDPAPATQNAAATRCDDASFSGAGFSGAVTRTFVIPRAQRLPSEFGLAETAAVQSPQGARTFVATVRRKLASCHGRDLGTKVTQVAQTSTDADDVTVWRLDVDVSRKKTVHFLMAVIRNRNLVAQVTFVPSGDATIRGTDFTALAERAQQRLAYLIPTP